MKFNIFDESTWDKMEPVDHEKITNKALGSIGQLIPQVRSLREKIIGLPQIAKTNRDFLIAAELLKNNSQAYQLMEISYKFPSDKVADFLAQIDAVLEFWKSYKKDRGSKWRDIAPLLKQLVPYLDKGLNRYYSSAEMGINGLFSIEVYGNAAWVEYLKQVKLNDNLSAALEYYKTLES